MKTTNKGKNTRPFRLSAQERKEIVAKYEEGNTTLAKLGAEHGVSTSTIRYTVSRAKNKTQRQWLKDYSDECGLTPKQLIALLLLKERRKAEAEKAEEHQ